MGGSRAIRYTPRANRVPTLLRGAASIPAARASRKNSTEQDHFRSMTTFDCNQEYFFSMTLEISGSAYSHHTAASAASVLQNGYPGDGEDC